MHTVRVNISVPIDLMSRRDQLAARGRKINLSALATEALRRELSRPPAEGKGPVAGLKIDGRP